MTSMMSINLLPKVHQRCQKVIRFALAHTAGMSYEPSHISRCLKATMDCYKSHFKSSFLLESLLKFEFRSGRRCTTVQADALAKDTARLWRDLTPPLLTGFYVFKRFFVTR